MQLIMRQRHSIGNDFHQIGHWLNTIFPYMNYTTVIDRERRGI